MGEVEAKGDRVERHALRHDRHTISMLTDHLVFSPKYRGKVLLGEVGEAAEENLSLEKKALPKKHEFPHLREWCPGHLWAPSCYHGSVGQGCAVVEKYISGQKGYSYAKTDAIPVVVINEENDKALKIGYITLHTKLFTVTCPVS